MDGGLDSIGENCGIAAISIKKGSKNQGKAPMYLYKLLLHLQHRGQLSAGITIYNPKRPQIIDTYKKLGLVNEAFRTHNPAKNRQIFSEYAGNVGIGHVRYATCGADKDELAQPFERHHGRKWKWFSFGFNGNIANYSELKKQLLKKAGYHITYDTDTEIIMHYLARQLMSSEKPDLVKVFSNLSRKFDGCYNLIFLNAKGEMVILRDPYGFRPLCYGIKDDMMLFASESNALINFGIKIEDVHNIPPGHMALVKDHKMRIIRYAPTKRISHCMFEWVYFANVCSSLDGRSVYINRTNLGQELARNEKLKVNTDDYIVVPIPHTSIPAGQSYAYDLGLRAVEGLVANRFVGRTFIESRDRFDKVRAKFTVLRKVLRGKKVIAVDDSIVRGNTVRSLVRYLKKEGGAKEVHLRITCPPIISPCFYGIDMSTIGELFARRYLKKLVNGKVPDKIQRKMAKDIGADSLVYQSIQGLVKSLRIPRNKLCMACINSDYPTPYGRNLYRKAARNNKKQGSYKRTYE